MGRLDEVMQRKALVVVAEEHVGRWVAELRAVERAPEEAVNRRARFMSIGAWKRREKKRKKKRFGGIPG